MELREPKRKRRARISLQQPFPILMRDVTTNKALWQVYTGKYCGDFVMIDAPDEIAAIHNMGFFGKGSLSRSGPEFGKERQGTPPFIRQRQWERRCKWAEQQKKLIKEFNKSQNKCKVKDNHESEEVIESNSKTPRTCSKSKTNVIVKEKKISKESKETDVGDEKAKDDEEIDIINEKEKEVIIDNTDENDKEEIVDVITEKDKVKIIEVTSEKDEEMIIDVTTDKDKDSILDVTTDKDKEEIREVTSEKDEIIIDVTTDKDEEGIIDVTTDKDKDGIIDVTTVKDKEGIVDVTSEKDEEMDIDVTVEKDDLTIDVTTVDGDDGENQNNRENSKNTDDDVITLDSAEEDNGSKITTLEDNNKTQQKQNLVDKIVEKENKEIQSKVEDQKENELENKGNVGLKRKICIDLESEYCDDSNKEEEEEEEEISHLPVSMCSGRKVLVLPDSDDDDEGYLANICPRLEREQFPIHESLHLTLEEAFFLSYGLGCLQVFDLFGNFLSIDGMWQLFCKSQKDFIQKYVTYHYFRSKGWVVKPGIKFGGDFLLYKQGPPFYHASYIVVLEVIDNDTLKSLPAVQQTWTKILGLNRLAESAGKEVLLCKVIWPSEVSPDDLEFPSVLPKFKVHEILVRRWIPSQEREENDML